MTFDLSSLDGVRAGVTAAAEAAAYIAGRAKTGECAIRAGNLRVWQL